MMKRIRKGLTLLELVIAMALASIVVAGATVIFFSLDKMSKAEIKSFTETSDVKKLITVVDGIISDPKNSSFVIETSNSPQTLLFTITENNGVEYEYSFVENSLTKTNVSTSASEDLFTTDYDVTITIHEEATHLYKFTFHYGNDLGSTMYLVKEINA